MLFLFEFKERLFYFPCFFLFFFWFFFIYALDLLESFALHCIMSSLSFSIFFYFVSKRHTVIICTCKVKILHNFLCAINYFLLSCCSSMSLLLLLCYFSNSSFSCLCRLLFKSFKLSSEKGPTASLIIIRIRLLLNTHSYSSTQSRNVFCICEKKSKRSMWGYRAWMITVDSCECVRFTGNKMLTFLYLRTKKRKINNNRNPKSRKQAKQKSQKTKEITGNTKQKKKYAGFFLCTSKSQCLNTHSQFDITLNMSQSHAIEFNHLNSEWQTVNTLQTFKILCMTLYHGIWYGMNVDSFHYLIWIWNCMAMHKMHLNCISVHKYIIISNLSFIISFWMKKKTKHFYITKAVWIWQWSGSHLNDWSNHFFSFFCVHIFDFVFKFYFSLNIKMGNETFVYVCDKKY